MTLRRFFITITSTFFYVGYLPSIPGTFGSLAGIALFYLVKNTATLYFFTAAGLTVLGILVTGKAEKLFTRKDPREIVIDEVSGMLLSLMFIPYDVKYIVMGFFLFRLFDTLKPYPATKLQHLRGAKGIMLDDIVAGVYTNISLQVICKLAAFTKS